MIGGDVAGLCAKLGIDLRPAHGGNAKANCPHPDHDDLRPSWSINLDTGKHNCFSCDFQGGPYVLVNCAFGLDPAASMELLEGFGLHDPKDRSNGNGAAPRPKPPAKDTAPPITEADVERWCAAPPTDTPADPTLERTRGWTREGMDRVQAGKHEGRIAFAYRDPKGTLTGAVLYDPMHDPDKDTGSKTFAIPGTKRQLFPSPRIWDRSKAILLVEGEPDAVSAISCGLQAVGVPGAGNWKADWGKEFSEARVVVVADCDEPGRLVAKQSAKDIAPYANEVRLLDLGPEKSKGYDLGDLVSEKVGESGPEKGRDLAADELRQRAKEAEIVKGPEPVTPATGQKEAGDTADPQAKQLLKIVAGDAHLFRTPEGVAFATWNEDGTTVAVGSNQFAHRLGQRYYAQTGKVAKSQPCKEAIDTAAGEALFAGEEHEVFVRLAGDMSRSYLDLGNPEMQVVEITEKGWEITTQPEVKFRRPRGLLPLPAPERGGSLDDLWRFVNVREEDRPLAAAWMLGALCTRGPYPILGIHGEQGSAKSATSRRLRQLIDPNTAPLRSAPQSAQDLMIAATNSRIVAFDNLSHIKEWLSDQLCCIATGAGFAVRELYTGSEETIYAASRPILWNGIPELASRPDLAERTMQLELPRLKSRETERGLDEGFSRAHPRILGALLDAVALAHKSLPEVDLADPPRMADFAEWAVAGIPSFGWTPEKFLEAYKDNRKSTTDAALDSSPVFAALEQLDSAFGGSASDLLKVLVEIVGEEKVARRKDWPKQPSQLGSELRRLSPNLRERGFVVEFTRTRDTRHWEIVPPGAVTPVTPSQGAIPGTNTQAQPDSRDAGDAGDAEERGFFDGIAEGIPEDELDELRAAEGVA